jgi:hypothetical protein
MDATLSTRLSLQLHDNLYSWMTYGSSKAAYQHTNTKMPQVSPRVYSRQISMPRDGELDTTIASPRIPVEIIDYILKLALMLPRTDFTTPQFHSIASVTLASMMFRQIAFRWYFRDITPITRAHWAGLSEMLSAQDGREVARGGKGAFIWVRYVYARGVQEIDIVYALISNLDQSAHRQRYLPTGLRS